MDVYTGYIQDTWRFSGDAPYWAIGDIVKYSVMHSKERYQELLKQTFKSFEGLIFPLKTTIVPHHTENNKLPVVINGVDKSLDMNLKDIQRAIEDFGGDIYELQIEVAIRVYCKEKDTQEKITRVWLNLNDEITISAGKEDPSPSVMFALSHLLFNPDVSEISSHNLELYYKNQPLLETALRNWEERLGTINEYGGYGAVAQYGILEE
ncbi:hypothetical protein [Aureispira anguillae]|uniref:Uncharacterized protein n=1 Tax=Aureispira anguillae TaxID=2864201 RepID=A0A915YLL3_9BACT|nr:hypothetical protein [Aureispira anguillae]BDS15482.1 hypothetical protein AsAng_0062660 [Aureispira anguillae]